MNTQIIHKGETRTTIAVESPTVQTLLLSLTSGYLPLRYTKAKAHKLDKFNKREGAALALERLPQASEKLLKIKYVCIKANKILVILKDHNEIIALRGYLDKPLLRLTKSFITA